MITEDRGGDRESSLEERQQVEDKVNAALAKIRPALQADGGDVELVGIDNGIVKVRLTGACGGCPLSQMTLTYGIERALKAEVPEVKRVVAA